MPRTNVPFRSARYFSNKKRIFRTYDMRSGNSEQGASRPVNNIIVFPNNSETTINVLGDNSQSLPYGNLLKKIKGRKRKEKQRLKKKHIPQDVKPFVNKMKDLKTEKMKPKMNKHIIFLSDSDSDSEIEKEGNDKETSVCNNSTDKIDCNKEDEDDDVIFVETPAAEIIEIDDSTEQSTEVTSNNPVLAEPSEANPSDSNDFLDSSHINIQSKFNFELHGSEFKGAEFLKPSTVAKDMSESGSVSSVSDVSATIGLNVFNVEDFPQEKVNLFDDTDLEKFRNAITPQRLTKKSKNTLNDGNFTTPECRTNQNDLPALSDIQVEDNSRKQRGRSIIKELVNDRAYVLLSSSQKKMKNKKSKSKDSSSTTSEVFSENDQQESSKKKKKKKSKKKESSTDKVDSEKCSSPSRNDVDNGKYDKQKEKGKESEDEAPKCTIAIRSDLFQSVETETTAHIKKSKKNKMIEYNQQNSAEDLENINKHKGVTEDAEDKKKKKAKTTSELSHDRSMDTSIQENYDEKKKKKNRKNMEISEDSIFDKQETDTEASICNVRPENEEKKKKKNRRTSEGPSGLIVEKKKLEIPPVNIDCEESNEEKRKKKNRKTLQSSIVAPDNIEHCNSIQESPANKKNISKPKDSEELISSENNEETEVPQVQKNLEPSFQINSNEVENVMDATISRNQDRNEKESKETNINCDKTNKIKTEPPEVTLGENNDTKNVAQCSDESATLYDNDQEPESRDIKINVFKEYNNQNNDEIIKPDAVDALHTQNSNDIQKKSEEEIRMNRKRISDCPEISAKKQKLNEQNPQTNTVDQVNEAEKNRTYQAPNVVSTKTQETVVEDEIIEKDTQEKIIGKNQCENASNSTKKRKTTISDSNDDLFEAKRIKTHSESSQPLLPNEKDYNVNLKKLETENRNEILNEKSENTTVAVKEKSCSDNTICTDVEVRPIEHEKDDKNNKSENSDCNVSNLIPVFVNDEHAIQIENVFSFNNSTASDEHNFTVDLKVDNFADKSNTSWGTNPHVLNSTTVQTSSEKIDGVSNEESASTATTTSSGLLDVESEHISVSESIPAITSSLNDPVERNVLKIEENISDIVPSEDMNDIHVKIEEESEADAKTIVEQTNEEVSSVKKNTALSNITLENENTPVETSHQELPNDIEEIVREKENLDTVKRLCEFFEKAKDTNEVLKKVSLLKQAFTDKSQNLDRSREEVHITCDKDDIFSISSDDSSILCVEDSVSVVSIDDEITLANCDLSGEKESSFVEVQKAKNNSLVECSSDSNEVIGDEVTLIDRNESVAGTSQSFMNSTFTCIEPERVKKGLDKYEVEDIQEHMSSDPKLWKIVPEDICPVRLPIKGKRCVKCREIGHLAYNCPNRLNLPKCSLCGIEGHLDFRCPNKLCTQCGRKAPTMQPVCEHCKHFKFVTCVLCNNKGHPKNKCPDLWRRYHLTMNDGPMVYRNLLELKSKRKLWCSCCAGSGHLEYQCAESETWRLFRNFQTLDPRIHNYEDIYNPGNKMVNESQLVQNCTREVASDYQISTNENNSSNQSSIVTQNTDSANPCQMSSNAPISEIKERLECSSGDIAGLIEKNIDETKTKTKNDNLDINVDEQGHQNFFMTADMRSLKRFLNNELGILRGTKFRIIDLIPRFIAFQQDSKLPEDKSKFGAKRKAKFYKQLNMLLFGKWQVKNGKVQVNKLKQFLCNNKLTYVPDNMRESLWCSYDSIFRPSPHEHVNYMFFLKSLKEKYGNRKVL